jgi:hypothetical protein
MFSNPEYNPDKKFYFLVFRAIQRITTITRATKKKAHHIPALKIVSMAPQLLKTNVVKINTNRKGDSFIVECFMYLKIQLLYQFIFLEKSGKNNPI